MGGWQAFWVRILSPATARFVLALLALGLSGAALFGLLTVRIDPNNRDALFLALGLVLGLSTTAFGYYFGSTARGDAAAQEVEVVNTASAPVPVETQREEPE